MADLEHYKRYGYTVSETNLKTLPESASQAAKDLAQWLTLEGRRSSLVEWLGCFSEATGRIHGKFWNIGAWTHRMAHSNPNSANIPAPFHGDPKSPVEEVKARYDGPMRECFTTPEGAYLVGCDAAGIQLRILAHYMKSLEYVEAIVNGVKEDGTDIHNLNRKALGSTCRDRDVAKTFIYAWLLGAGVGKIASILGCSMPQAKKAIDNFLSSLPELKKVKTVMIPRDASRGFFIGLDGRKVPCTSDHLMLAGYLQNGEAVIMKRATLKWIVAAKKEGINFKLVNFVHDEWQVEVTGTKSEADRMGQIMCQALVDVGDELDLFCPLEGEYRVGQNWAETH